MFLGAKVSLRTLLEKAVFSDTNILYSYVKDFLGDSKGPFLRVNYKDSLLHYGKNRHLSPNIHSALFISVDTCHLE